MGKNREKKKEKKWNKKSSGKEVLNSKYIRNKVKLTENKQLHGVRPTLVGNFALLTHSVRASNF